MNVQVPFYFKEIVDSLSIPVDVGSAQGVWTVAGTVIVGCELQCVVHAAGPAHPALADGLARIFATVFQELRSAIFTNVAQSAIRRVARGVFTHLLDQDIAFHLQRQTGGLMRAIDRGTKSVSKPSHVCSLLTWHRQGHLVHAHVDRLPCHPDGPRNLNGVCHSGASTDASLVGRPAHRYADLQLRLELCRHHAHHDGSLLVVHHPHDVLAVSVVPSVLHAPTHSCATA